MKFVISILTLLSINVACVSTQEEKEEKAAKNQAALEDHYRHMEQCPELKKHKIVLDENGKVLSNTTMLDKDGKVIEMSNDNLRYKRTRSEDGKIDTTIVVDKNGKEREIFCKKAKKG